LVAIETSLDNWKNGTDPSSAHKPLSFDEKIVKIRLVYPEILDYIRHFLAVLYQTYVNKPVISGVTRQKFTKFLDEVAPSSPLLTRTARP